MRVLVTGGSGFIGSHVVRALQERHEVSAPTHAELELSDADAVAAWFARHPMDAVVHTAVRPGHRNAADPSRQLDINLRMYLNLFRCRNAWGRMVYLSSGAVYGTQRDVVRATEDEVGVVVPLDEHGFSRYVTAELGAAAEGVVELRPFGVFGAGEDYAIRFISNAICKTLFDLPVTLRQDRRFSYLYVDDIVPVVERFLERDGAHKAYNVTPDTSCRLRELAELVVRLSGKDLPIVVGEEGMGLEYTGDSSRLKAEAPELHFTSLEKAVQTLHGWYADHRDVIERETLLVDK